MAAGRQGKELRDPIFNHKHKAEGEVKPGSGLLNSTPSHALPQQERTTSHVAPYLGNECLNVWAFEGYISSKLPPPPTSPSRLQPLWEIDCVGFICYFWWIFQIVLFFDEVHIPTVRGKISWLLLATSFIAIVIFFFTTHIKFVSSFSTERKRKKMHERLKIWERRKDHMVFQNLDWLDFDRLFSVFSLMGIETFFHCYIYIQVAWLWWDTNLGQRPLPYRMIRKHEPFNSGRQKLIAGHCQSWLVFQRNTGCCKWELKGKLIKPTRLVINAVFLPFSETKYLNKWRYIVCLWVRYQNYIFIYISIYI